MNFQFREECYECTIVSSKNACQIRPSPTLRHKASFPYEWPHTSSNETGQGNAWRLARGLRTSSQRGAMRAGAAARPSGVTGVHQRATLWEGFVDRISAVAGTGSMPWYGVRPALARCSKDHASQ